MLEIREQQIEFMVTKIQDEFVIRLAEHLKKVSITTERRTEVDFLSHITLKKLKAELDYLINSGFSHEADLAIAFEFIELFIPIENKAKIREIVIKENTIVSKKLELLWNLTRKGKVHEYNL